MKQTADKEGITPRASSPTATRRAFREMARRSACRTTTSSAPPRSGTTAASEEIWRRMAAKTGDIFLKKYAGWYSVRDEAYYAESETEVGDDGVRRGPRGHAGRMDRGGDLLLPPVGLPGQAARALRGESRFHPAAGAAQRGGELRQGRPGGPVDLAHDARLGHPGAGRADGARHVRVGRRADQLHHRRRLPRREQPALALLAGRRARHRQGHRALPRGLLAGVPDVGRASSCRSASSATASC